MNKKIKFKKGTKIGTKMALNFSGEDGTRTHDLLTASQAL